ncbi:MAG: glutamate racemase [Ignavibacteria bacterium]|nr:glutamate racemase [Ignavibacteria bacterium]
MRMLQKKNLRSRPIGIFDSGIGGLTVAKAVFNLLPNEDVIYLGDTARLPYGTKSKETVILYSIECMKFLLSKKVKMVVVACNTASSVAVNFLSKITKVPVIGVISPGSKTAVKSTNNKKVGVIGTYGTIKSKSYNKEIRKYSKDVIIFSQPCSLFVQLAEDGWTENRITYLTASEYLKELKKRKIDTLILGCTHYPILKKTISKVIGKNIKLIDSGEETAKEVKIILEERNLLSKRKKKGNHRFFVTDFPNNFKSISERFLGKKINNVKKAKLT